MARPIKQRANSNQSTATGAVEIVDVTIVNVRCDRKKKFSKMENSRPRSLKIRRNTKTERKQKTKAETRENFMNNSTTTTRNRRVLDATRFYFLEQKKQKKS